MPKCYKKEDIVNKLSYKYPYIKEDLDKIHPVIAIELNEDLEIMLKQLGYEKVVRCKECKHRYNPKRCPYAEFEWLKETEVPGDFYCGNGEKKDESR